MQRAHTSQGAAGTLAFWLCSALLREMLSMAMCSWRSGQRAVRSLRVLQMGSLSVFNLVCRVILLDRCPRPTFSVPLARLLFIRSSL